MPVSPAVRTEVIERARKDVAYQTKWGRLAGAWLMLFGILMIALALAVVLLLKRFSEMPGNPGPAGQKAIWQGFVLGMIFGAIAMCLALKGLAAFHHAIEAIRGNPVSQMLVEYHDALVGLAREQGMTGPEGAAATSQRAPIAGS